MVIWNHPGVDVTGMVARCEKVAGTCEKLLGGEVYHYVTKFMMKPARIGGRHVWHQDYGYWYQYGNLFPNMMTTFVAIDNATKEMAVSRTILRLYMSLCFISPLRLTVLKYISIWTWVLKGSHKCGRIDHSSLDGQQCADMERVEEIAKQVPLEYVELERGDALFFHCNLLHCSSANTSPSRRWAFICVYNRADNNPVKAHYHPFYTPLEKVPNSAILECQDFTTMDGKWFNDPITDNIPTG
ncbi:L-proline trans-4-hydroxylase-like [Ruditapes philippinarum]|uniref:L-proline trans-4-hydroxylase-like n=1 Tax=Ruditapes philippinarum TaxID=129788 RepID=UPI00295A6B17|nr:L-proline trans-4-hydroxylase-like [Ruditapes philippinarum]